MAENTNAGKLSPLSFFPICYLSARFKIYLKAKVIYALFNHNNLILECVFFDLKEGHTVAYLFLL